MNIYLTGGTALLLAAVPAVWAQGGLTRETVEAFELYVSLPGGLTPILQSAKDKASADKAAAKLREFLPRVYEARSAVEKIPQLPPKDVQELERRFGKQAQEGWGAVYREIFRLQKAQCFDSLAFAKEFNILCMMLK